MKKMFLTTILMFSLFSCTQTEISENNVNDSKIARMLNEDDRSSQILMYNLLSAEEKFKIWDDQISEILTAENLSIAQFNLISDLKNNLNVSLFDVTNNSDEKEIFKHIYVTNFLMQAQELFGDDFVYKNFYTFARIKSPNFIGEPEDPIIPNCTCNTESAFSCVGQTDPCTATNRCKSTRDGCGFLFWFECDGRCFFA